MLRGAISAIQRWQYRGGRPGWSARIANRLGALSFAKGIAPGAAATLEVRGHKSGRMISFPVVVADYQGERYLVAMLGQKTNWARNLRADGHAVLRRGRPEDVCLVEELSESRAAYRVLADRRPLSGFSGRLSGAPVSAGCSVWKPGPGSGVTLRAVIFS